MGLGLGFRVRARVRVRVRVRARARCLDLGDDVLALAHAVQVGEHRDGLARLDRLLGRGVQHGGLVRGGSRGKG